MSIFSRISKSRQQAREHNAKLAEQQKKEAQKTPYRHVPTHAASDAIASAPPGWREADRSRIKEENRRRSAMAAATGGGGGSNGHMSMNMSMNMTMMHMNMNMMNMPGVPRVGSSLSHVSFPTDVNANPMVRLPRSYSYNGLAPLPVMYQYPPSSHHASQSSREVIYSVPDPGATLSVAPSTTTATATATTTTTTSSSSKGKEAVYRPSFDASRVSPTHLKHLGDVSGSSSGSNSSQDDLEMKVPVPDGGHAGRPQIRPSTATTEALHRMRPGRRISDSSIDRIAMANHARALRDARPPTSMRPVAAPTFPMHQASMPVAYTTSAVLNHPGRNETENQISPATSASSSRTREEAEQTNEDIGEEEEEESFEDAPEFSGNQEPVPVVTASPPVAPFNPDRSKDVNRPPSAALHRLETASSVADSRTLSPSYTHYQTAAPASKPASRPPPITQDPVILNVFPEAAECMPATEAKEKSRRFSRSGGRFKNRWSSSRNYPVAV